MGLFQVMGFNYAAAGYGSAVEMRAALTRGGLLALLACGIAFMRSKGLLKKLGAHYWKGFAAGYNGTAYWKNEYTRSSPPGTRHGPRSCGPRRSRSRLRDVSTITIDEMHSALATCALVVNEALAYEDAIATATAATDPEGRSTRC